MPPAHVYLVRHAESTWNAAGLWQGQADPPLSERGTGQAAALAEYFPDTDVTHLLTSDQQRARQTAEPFGARFGLDAEVWEVLREIDVGSWSGRTRDEIRAADPGAIERYHRGEAGWEGGETFEAHEERCRRAVDRLEAISSDGVVVAVSHGATIRGVVRTMLGIPHTERWRLSGPAHTSVTHLSTSPAGWRMQAFSAVRDIRRV